MVIKKERKDSEKNKTARMYGGHVLLTWHVGRETGARTSTLDHHGTSITELVNCIIDNLNPSDDQATLFNCALVGRAWAYASQRSIFQTIRLKVPNPDYIIDNADKSCVFDRVRIDHESGRHISRFVEAIYRLIVSLDEKPILASYVQCLELQNFDGVGKATPGYRINDACTSVAEVVNRLSRVRKLSMFCIKWEGLSSMLRTALTSMFSAPSITKITFHSFTIPTITDFASLLGYWELLGHSVHLKALDLVNVIFSKESSANINHTGPSLKLDTIAFGGSEPTFLLWLQQRSCPLRFENLRSLKTWVKSSGNYEITTFVLQQAGSSLTKLELNLRLGSSVRLGSHRELAESALTYFPHLKAQALLLRSSWICSQLAKHPAG